jgi:DNA polymerase II
MSGSFSGWLLDLYPAPLTGEGGMIVWLLGDDGQRRRFTHEFPVTFYAAGPAPRLRALWKTVQQTDNSVALARSERRDVFSGVIPVLSATVPRPAEVQKFFRQVSDTQPGLAYYDADIPLALRYAARFDVFPLARCRIEAEGERVLAIEPCDTPWDLDPLPAPLRILSLEPDRDPLHAAPAGFMIAYDKVRYTQPLEPARALLINLRAVLERYDPDLILTSWGDTWLLPLLMQQSKKLGLPLPLNRDPEQDVTLHKAHTYFSYGQIVYRGQQVQLHGRWHLDRHNTMLWGDYALEGVLEMARVTALPVQDAARLSPGTGISSMQFTTALRRRILIPWHKAQPETPKTALDLIHSDMGGLVYQPTVGLHRDVGGIDFVSMYPGIMVHFNISPEVPRSKNGDLTPAPGEPGLIPQTLAPLLEKRLRLKAWLNQMHPHDPRREVFMARASAAKWLLVTCFGYLGYKNARFGRIEAHEAVTAYGREALIRAKEAAEDLGYNILHMYVDGLWVRRDGCRTPGDFEALLREISARTDLPIALDGIYRWVVFLPSRVDERVPVANRYFGVFQDGTLKVRGIECRRRDTPVFISELQMELLSILARAPDADRLPDCLPPARALLDRRLSDLRTGRVPLEKLLLAQKLSRELQDYRSPSPAARAALQLAKTGRTLRPGQRVRFLLTRGEPGIHAWDLPEPPDPRTLDVPRYRALTLRAAETVLKAVD